MKLLWILCRTKTRQLHEQAQAQNSPARPPAAGKRNYLLSTGKNTVTSSQHEKVGPIIKKVKVKVRVLSLVPKLALTTSQF